MGVAETVQRDPRQSRTGNDPFECLREGVGVERGTVLPAERLEAPIWVPIPLATDFPLTVIG